MVTILSSGWFQPFDAANQEVLVAVQELSLPKIAQALIAAKARWSSRTGDP